MYHAKWNKSVGERQISDDFTQMWKLGKKKKQINTEEGREANQEAGSCE